MVCKHNERCGRYRKTGYTCSNPDNIPETDFNLNRRIGCADFRAFEEKAVL
jgi:hypothetical protein